MTPTKSDPEKQKSKEISQPVARAADGSGGYPTTAAASPVDHRRLKNQKATANAFAGGGRERERERRQPPCLKSTADMNSTRPRPLNENYPCPSLLSPAWALCTGRSGWSITEGHFWAESNGMRIGHWLLVTKPAGAGAGARSREKRPARTPPLLVKFHSSKLQAISPRHGGSRGYLGSESSISYRAALKPPRAQTPEQSSKQ